MIKTNPKVLLISSKEQKSILDNRLLDAIDIVEIAMGKRANGNVFLPDKISAIFNNETQDRINCMPGGLPNDNLYGVKWVSVFPNNPVEGYRNVSGIIILSELTYGHTLSIMDAGYLTEIRTAAIGATAAKKLARESASTIGFIGAGQQARRHLELIKAVRPKLSKCYVSSRTTKTVREFISEESSIFGDIEFIDCGNDYAKAIIDADIIVTAISGQEDILKANWVKEGATYIHVGGWEDEYEVAKSASKIICDEWESVKHRTQTISKMYNDNLLTDEDIYGNLDEIITGKKKARENEDEFIYFCSVGLAHIDISFANYIYDYARKNKIGSWFQF